LCDGLGNEAAAKWASLQAAALRNVQLLRINQRLRQLSLVN
jgi:hypothetical protein